MRRLLALLVGMVAVLALTLTAVALPSPSQRGGSSGDWMDSASMMSDSGGAAVRRGGVAGWMHGAAAQSEFGYLTEMVAHHEEAVSAARELRRSARPAMREFGQAVVRTQSTQIEQMRTWLAEWYPGRSTVVAYEPMMRDLTTLSGDQLDSAFLRDMIPHHMSAVMMSQQQLVRGSAGHPEVSLLAASIRDEQHAEIFQMRQWLQDWFGAAWQPHAGMGMGMDDGAGRPMTHR